MIRELDTWVPLLYSSRLVCPVFFIGKTHSVSEPAVAIRTLPFLNKYCTLQNEKNLPLLKRALFYSNTLRHAVLSIVETVLGEWVEG